MALAHLLVDFAKSLILLFLQPTQTLDLEFVIGRINSHQQLVLFDVASRFTLVGLEDHASGDFRGYAGFAIGDDRAVDFQLQLLAGRFQRTQWFDAHRRQSSQPARSRVVSAARRCSGSTVPSSITTAAGTAKQQDRDDEVDHQPCELLGAARDSIDEMLRMGRSTRGGG